MKRWINLNQLKADFPLVYRVMIKGDLTEPVKNSWATARLKFNKLKALDIPNKV